MTNKLINSFKRDEPHSDPGENIHRADFLAREWLETLFDIATPLYLSYKYECWRKGCYNETISGRSSGYYPVSPESVIFFSFKTK